MLVFLSDSVADDIKYKVKLMVDFLMHARDHNTICFTIDIRWLMAVYIIYGLHTTVHVLFEFSGSIVRKRLQKWVWRLYTFMFQGVVTLIRPVEPFATRIKIFD